MTYPDRETKPRRWVGLAIVILLVLYVAFAVEAKMTEQVCISAMSQEIGQDPVTVPEICT